MNATVKNNKDNNSINNIKFCLDFLAGVSIFWGSKDKRSLHPFIAFSIKDSDLLNFFSLIASSAWFNNSLNSKHCGLLLKRSFATCNLGNITVRSEEHTSELQSQFHL